MKGTLILARSLLEHSPQELQQQIVDFTDQGVVFRQYNVDDATSWIDIDHPDFDVEDARYTLTLTRLYDPTQFMNGSFKLTKLERITEHGDCITVKDYV
jgi:hypothetical protein